MKKKGACKAFEGEMGSSNMNPELSLGMAKDDE